MVTTPLKYSLKVFLYSFKGTVQNGKLERFSSHPQMTLQCVQKLYANVFFQNNVGNIELMGMKFGMHY